jgi:alkanesulfonate monooxygenase SsuD/methylene tetrahydromethanopterin reductase-like flavin-dependent oxidoreductase (luciferase family)
MSMDGRALAVSVVPLETRREAIIHIATTADRLGYDAFFLPEAWAYDGTVLLAEVATRTRRIRLGTGIVNVWGRTAATIAMAAATLQAVSGGRFVLGLGASTAQLTEGLHDVPFAAPVERLRQVIVRVRALLAGNRITLAATPGARPLRLGIPAVRGLPIYLAGLTGASIRLTGEFADGWLPFLFPRSRLGEGMRLLREGAAPRGAGDSLAVCPVIPTAVGDNGAIPRDRAAWFVIFYLTSMGELYRRMLARHGYGAEVEAVLAANPPRTAPVIPRGAEGLLGELAIFGSPAAARAQLALWYEAGASMPVLLLSPDLTPDEIDRTLRAFRASSAA